eukprot:349632-Chlamydomonas_euryale.AAC.34
MPRRQQRVWASQRDDSSDSQTCAGESEDFAFVHCLQLYNFDELSYWVVLKSELDGYETQQSSQYGLKGFLRALAAVPRLLARRVCVQPSMFEEPRVTGPRGVWWGLAGGCPMPALCIPNWVRAL